MSYCVIRSWFCCITSAVPLSIFRIIWYIPDFTVFFDQFLFLLYCFLRSCFAMLFYQFLRVCRSMPCWFSYAVLYVPGLLHLFKRFFIPMYIYIYVLFDTFLFTLYYFICSCLCLAFSLFLFYYDIWSVNLRTWYFSIHYCFCFVFLWERVVA